MKNSKIKTYMDLVCNQVKFKDIHNNIKEELMDHMDNIIKENLEKDFSLEESINMAIKQMGDPYILGQDLNKVHKAKPEWSILALTLVFTLIGISTVYALSSMDLIPGWSTHGIMRRSIIMAVIGMGLIILLYIFDYRKIKPFSKYIYIIASLLLIFGEKYNIFYRITTDLSYITPFLYAVALSGMFSEERWERGNKIVSLLILYLPVFFIMFQRSITTPTIMYLVMISALSYMLGEGIKYILFNIASCTGLGIFLVINRLYVRQRLLNLLNPFRDPLGAGYLSVQIKKMLSSAGILGNGFIMNRGNMPMGGMHTEFIFSYIIYTFGWLAGIGIIALSIIFFIRLIKATKSVRDNYGRLLMGTISSLFIIQFLYNILMILGIAPMAGISLPFISYGTVLNTVNMVMIGIVISVYKRKEIITQ